MSVDPKIRAFMRASVDAGKKSISEGGVKPKVGIVIVKDGELIGESYRGETGDGRHAEFGLVDAVGPENLRGTTVFTTLEPCSQRNHPKVACATHLINAGVRTVYVGMYDPNPAIYLVGWKMLQDAGIVVRDYPDDLREEIRSDNREFVQSYKLSIGERGSARFDYSQNGGKYSLKFDDIAIETRWTNRGSGSIYAVSDQYHVALNKYANEFDEIDNPGSLDWANHAVPVSEGQIGLFRSENGYALVMVNKVIAGDGKGHTELQFDYEIRSKKQYEW